MEKEILSISPWKKFEGKIEHYPIFLKKKKSPDHVMLYIKDEKDLPYYINHEGVLDEDFYYIYIPPLPKGK